MTDPFETTFRAEAEKIPVVVPDAAAAVARGRRIALRRRAALTMTAAVVVAAGAMVIPKLPLTSEQRGSKATIAADGSSGDITLLAVSVNDDSFQSPYSAVVVKPYDSELCFTFPDWIDKATISSGAGSTVATFPGINVRSESGVHISCDAADRAALAALAASPESHEMQMEGRGRTTTATLEVRQSLNIEDARRKLESSTESMATEALNGGDLKKAIELGRSRLRGADDEDDWDYGNAVHYGHLILGHVALRRGDVVKAGQELLLAGKTPGSPQLNSFGPNMTLARDLLSAGQERIVLAYLDLVEQFWDEPEKLQSWRTSIRTEHEPNFGANLLYGHLTPAPIDEALLEEK